MASPILKFLWLRSDGNALYAFQHWHGVNRTGFSLLPLHYGHPPEYLYRRMVELGGLLCDTIVQVYGAKELVRRFSDPFWFHALSLVIGFDWNSSGTTTATLSAIKEYYSRHPGEIAVAGGKGRHMSATREEVEAAESAGLIGDADTTMRLAKRVARIDDAFLQDSYDLYMQFLVVGSGTFSVVQQGMNEGKRMARRYHWYSGTMGTMLDDNREGISAPVPQDSVLDLTASSSRGNRRAMVEVLRERPESLMSMFAIGGQRTLDSTGKPVLNLDIRVDWKRLRQLYEYDVTGFEQLVDMPGLGKSTLRAISYMAEVITGEKASTRDPVKFSFAVGGKDGVPKPVNVRDYDRAIEFFREAVGSLDRGDRRTRTLIENLSKLSRERSSQGPSL